MTREEAKHWLEIELKTWEDECKSKHPIKEAFSVAIETLGQEPVLDKIRAELTEKRDILVKEARANAINPLSCYGLDYALLIIDKYKAESEDNENRLKADMVAMLTEIQLEIEEYQKIHDSYCDHHIKGDVWEHHTREHYDSSSGKAIACDYCLKTIQQKINTLKGVEHDG